MPGNSAADNTLSLLKRVANKVLAPVGFHMVRIPKEKSRRVRRNDPKSAVAGENSPNSVRVLNLLQYTTTSGSDYDAASFQSGYHSITLDGKAYTGQRRPGDRLRTVPFDFHGKSVLDIGCNQGGMLLELSSVLSWGVGIDYDHRMVNAANRVRRHRGDTDLDFFVFDLESEPLDYIGDFLRSDRVDIVFLLSVCVWIKNWKDVVDWSVSIADNMLFESNGSDEQQLEQEMYLRKHFRNLTLVAGTSDDDPGQKSRKLYLCAKDVAPGSANVARDTSLVNG